MQRIFYSCILYAGLSAFTANMQADQDFLQETEINNQILQQHIKTVNAIDEYVNRIAKKLITVSDQPQINFPFKVITSWTAGLAFDQEDNSILLSSALLKQINDEAELAVVLSLGLAKYGNLPDPDQTTINNLYRAGYDPQALIDLQENYFFATPEHPSQWMGGLYTWPLTTSAISYNKSLLQSLPKGLSRDADGYRQAIRSN